MSAPTAFDEQARLIQSLRNPALYGVTAVQVVETHISYIVLTGQHAYKIKKAVDLGFLDFTTLDRRRFYCERELELNRRTAPSLYLDVVTITGTPDHPSFAAAGPAIEYAVRMREFPADALLERVLARGQLTPEHMDRLAETVAAFHDAASRANAESAFGRAADVLTFAVQNFTQLEPLLTRADDRAELERLREWTSAEHRRNEIHFEDRRRDGFVRECHGDLHLGNIALIAGAIVLFDCIEFNDQMRWTDVMNDVAFVWMDLQDHQRLDFASRFLNGYLTHTGDYSGLRLLRFYALYRAMVRAKVAGLRATQIAGQDEADAAMARYREYVVLSTSYARRFRPAIVITHGLTGSGKTTGSQALVERLGAIRIRTDVERKRLHSLSASARAAAAVESGLYTPAETERVYEHIRNLTREIVASDFTVIVDGAFLQRWQRDMFLGLAADLRVPFLIVDFAAEAAVLRERVERRQLAGTDASDAHLAVLEHQLQTQDPLGSDEEALTVRYDAAALAEWVRRPDAWRAVTSRLEEMTGSRAGEVP